MGRSAFQSGKLEAWFLALGSDLSNLCCCSHIVFNMFVKLLEYFLKILIVWSGHSSSKYENKFEVIYFIMQSYSDFISLQIFC